MRGLRPVQALAIAVFAVAVAPQLAYAADIVSYAIVNADGTLQVSERTIRLYGVHIPYSDRKSCRTFIRPARCGSRAALALDFKIGSKFVHCVPVTTYSDRSVGAICYAGRSAFDDGVDLGAYLIEQGWALAAPGAPFDYVALERIARANNRGVWGFTVDSIR